MFFKEYWFLLVLLFFSIIAMSYFYIIHRKELKLKIWQCIVSAIVMLIIGASIAFAFGKYIEFKSISVFGFLIFMPIVNLIYCKIRKLPKEACDILWIGDIIAYFIARFNCFYEGCCDGMIFSNGIKFPAREIEAMVFVFCIIIFITLNSKNKLKGLGQPIFLISYGSVRFIVEFFKANYHLYIESIPIHISHIWTTITLIIGIVYLIIQIKKNRKEQLFTILE